MGEIIHWDELPSGGITALWHPYILAGTSSPLAKRYHAVERRMYEVYALAEEQGIPRRTLERAKSEIAAKSVKIGDGWVWSLE